MKTYDYSFFSASLKRSRYLKSYTYPYYVIDAVKEIFHESGILNQPKLQYIDENPTTRDGTYIFETCSYADSPGHGLKRVQELVGNKLPSDLLSFYDEHQKALVVTRTFPLHFWHEDKIIEGIQSFREFTDKPIRVFRFAEQYDREATQFAMWLENPEKSIWKVISTAIGCIDDMDDEYVEPDRIIGPSFYEWLKSWVERDGLPDPFMDLGLEGGFLDPPTDTDMARIESRGLTG